MLYSYDIKFHKIARYSKHGVQHYIIKIENAKYD